MRAAALLLAAAAARADTDFYSADCVPPSCACTAPGGDQGLKELAARRDALKHCFRLGYKQEKRENWVEYRESLNTRIQDRTERLRAAHGKEKLARHWAKLSKKESVHREDKYLFEQFNQKRVKAEQKERLANREAGATYHQAVADARKEYAGVLQEIAGGGGATPAVRARTGAAAVRARAAAEAAWMGGDSGWAVPAAIAGFVAAAAGAAMWAARRGAGERAAAPAGYGAA